MHRHLSTGSATLSALMAARSDESRRSLVHDLFRLLAEMGDRSRHMPLTRPVAQPVGRPVAQPGEPRDLQR